MFHPFLVSRDRETTNDTLPASGNVSSNNQFRNQSPSTCHRRSRERERIERDISKEHTLNQSVEMTADHIDTFHEESRIVEDLLGYPSLNSDELEYTDSEYKHISGHVQSTPGRHHRTNSLQAIDRLTTKIACTKESIRREQTTRDGKIFFKK